MTAAGAGSALPAVIWKARSVGVACSAVAADEGAIAYVTGTTAGLAASSEIHAAVAHPPGEHGKLALGELVSVEETNVTVNDQPVKTMRFVIELETGARREVAVKTHLISALEDERRERILYDPARPSVALAWDALPGEPRLDRTGALQPAGVRALILAVPMALAVAGYSLALCL